MDRELAAANKPVRNILVFFSSVRILEIRSTELLWISWRFQSIKKLNFFVLLMMMTWCWQALVEIVKLTQNRGMQGSQGGWKEFLKGYDKQLGNSLSDPSKRTVEALTGFLRTFTKEEDIQVTFFTDLWVCCV